MAGRQPGGNAAGQQLSPAAAEARAACKAGVVAEAVAAWGAARPSSAGAGPAASGTVAAAAAMQQSAEDLAAWPGVPVDLPALPELPAEPCVSSACTGPFAKRARLVVGVEASPPAFALQPYRSHTATKLGRSGLWCLSCFSKPVGDYRVWLHGRCADEQPPGAAPAQLLNALLRAGPLDADASEGLRRRHASLLAVARVVPVPPAAWPQGRQDEARRGQVQ